MKKIQEERMRGYFIESAKNLLKGEGLKSISVRNVAHHAGYSYATLYHYFKDINELIFVCVKDFQQEAEAFIECKTRKQPAGLEKLRATAMAYLEYFVEYPGVFELFFLERMGDIGNKSETAERIYHFLERLCAPEWEQEIQRGTFSAERAESLKKQLNFAVTGMLLFYENRLHPDNYADFILQARTQIDEILCCSAFSADHKAKQ